MLDASIVIPTFNRRDALLETLDSLSRLNYPADRWEAVIVDDGSTDDTEPAVLRWIAETEMPARYIKRRNAGPASARNSGATAARGKVLIFIDNDIIVEPDFIRRHLQTLDSNPGCWVVGRIVHASQLRETPFGRYRDSVWEAFHISHQSSDVAETSGMTAANLSLPAVDFQDQGGFDEGFTIASSEDWDLGIRARKFGIRVLYDPRIVVVHNDWAVSLDRYCERQRLYSVSDVLLWRKYGEASPRARLVRENAPIKFGEDSLRIVIRKTLKSILAARTSRAIIRAGCRTVERLAPDSRLSHRAYDAAVAVAIFRGVREGLTRYCSSDPSAHTVVTAEKAYPRATPGDFGQE